MSSSASASAGGNPESWLVKQSTVGSSRLILPPTPSNNDLGFTLPNPPTTAAEAVAIMQSLRADGGLPTSNDYNEHNDGLYQGRLVQAIFKLILQCLDIWASDPANKDAATYTSKGREMRKH